MTASIWTPGQNISVSASIINPKDYPYLAAGNGTTNDKAALLAAFTAAFTGYSKTVYIPDGSYYLGTWDTSTRIFDFSAFGDNINIIMGSNVEFLVTTIAVCNPTVFYLRDNNNFYAGAAKFRDTGYNRVTQQGAIAYTAEAVSNDWRGLTISAILGTNLHSGVVLGNQSTNRLRAVNIGLIKTVDCNRGFNAQNQGDDVNIGLIHAVRNERAYFVYGVNGHKVKIFTEENYGTTGSVNISRSVGGYSTRDIDVTYTSRDNTLDLYHVLLNHTDLLGGEISNIRVNVDIQGSVAYDAVRIVNYSGSGGPEDASASTNIVQDVKISGSCDAQARPITVVASYGSKKQLDLRQGTNLVASQSVRDAFYLNTVGRAVSTTWTAPTPPVLNDGTLTCNYDLVDGVCTTTIILTAGAGTTYGVGEWTFTLPFTAKVTSVGPVYILDSGTAFYIGTCRVLAGANTIVIYTNASANSVRSNTPMTWATGDVLTATITFPVS